MIQRRQGSHSRPSPGFTLVEVLVALVILLVGVIVAIRIFPAGYNAFSEVTQTSKVYAFVDQVVKRLQDDPESIPDAILPLDATSADALAALASFDLNDPTAVNWNMLEANATSAEQRWLFGHLLPYYATTPQLADPPTAPAALRWPLMQPMSTQVMRRVQGEKVVVPSAFSSQKFADVDPGSVGTLTVLTVSSTVGLAAGMTIIVDNPSPNPDASAVIATVDSPTQITLTASVDVFAGATIRATTGFAPMHFPQFGPIITRDARGNALPPLVYDLRYRKVSKNQMYGLLADLGTLKDTLYYAVDPDPNQAILYFLPDLRPRNLRLTYSYVNAFGVIQVAPMAVPVPAAASEDDLVMLDLATAGLPVGARLVPGSELLNRSYRLGTNPYTLQSGEYYVSLSAGGLLEGAFHFSRDDAGRAVKLDYVIADWNILHEDLTVGTDGYVTLSLPDLKVRNTPAYPREPNTWGLYRPMADTSACAVLGLVDLRTGVVYHVLANNPQVKAPTYAIQPVNPGIPDPITAVDLANAVSGRVRLGGKAASPNQDWTALQGKTFRVFYRARRDWTMQIYRPPAMFWRVVPVGATPTADELGWDKFSVAGDRVFLPIVYAGQTVAVDYSYQDGDELRRISGEVHTLPARSAQPYSEIKLTYAPDPGAMVLVRGVSVTVRMWWVQPRSGPSYVFSATGKADGTLNEEWKSKSVTIMLPTSR